MKITKITVTILLVVIQSIKSENLSVGSTCQAHDGSKGTCLEIDNCSLIADKLRNRLVKPADVVCNQFLRYVCCPSESTLLSSRTSIWNLIEEGSVKCGKPAVAFGTAFHGTATKRGQFPWNAAITTSSDGKQICGGSLVSNKLVVTAAHCIEGKGGDYLFRPRDIFVVLGAHDLEARREPGRITASVEAIYVHNEWNPQTSSYDADIAIIELEDEVTFNRYIQPICLIDPKSEAATKTEGIIAGFGKSEHRESENIARVISSPILNYDVCVKSSDHESLLTRRTFCGGYSNGTSVCIGDSGSGLMVKHNGVYYLRGIVSSSLHDPIVGCNINTYSVFTDVLSFYGWITTGKDDQILLRELQEEILRLKMQSTTTNIPSTTRNLVRTQSTSKLTTRLYAITSRLTTTEKPLSLSSTHEFRLRNNCPFTIWPGILGNPGMSIPLRGGFKLDAYNTKIFHLERGWTGRIWARRDCDENGHCASGDCGNKIECNGAGGNPPATLAQFSLDGNEDQDNYDVSLVDGYNLPIKINLIPGTYRKTSNDKYDCMSAGCYRDLNEICPNELAIKQNGWTVACKSACLAFNTDEYCCRGAHDRPQTCKSQHWPQNYPAIFKQACPEANSYAYDDESSKFTCHGNPMAGYEVVFCP